MGDAYLYRTVARVQLLGKVEGELFDVFYKLLTEEDSGDEDIPPEYVNLVRRTLDLKADIEFGYTIGRDQISLNELNASRAYQRAVSRMQAEENQRMREEAKTRGNS